MKQSTLSVPDGKPLEVLTPDDGLSRSKTFLFQYLPLRVVCHTWNPTSKDGCGLFPKRLLQMISRESLLNEEREKEAGEGRAQTIAAPIPAQKDSPAVDPCRATCFSMKVFSLSFLFILFLFFSVFLITVILLPCPIVY